MSDILFLICVLVSTSCAPFSSKKEEDTPAPTKIQELLLKYNAELEDSIAVAAQTDGWLEVSECDGMLWAGKYSCGGGVPNIAAAEYVDEPGKFNRRPPPYCGEEFGNSKTTWSRDMGMGLMAHAWCKKDRAVLERHADYGVKKNWIMGSPFADGRVVYTPSIIGILYQVIYYTGGSDSTARSWPSIYSAGLDDYQAHLQIIDIWLRSEMSGEKDLQLEISQTMFERIKEHSDREPECPFYSYMRGIYEGSLEKTTDLLLQPGTPKCTYVRGGTYVGMSEWLFVAKLTLKKSGVME